MTPGLKEPFATEPLRTVLIDAVCDANNRIEVALDNAVAAGRCAKDAQPSARCAAAGALAAVVFADAAIDVAAVDGRPPLHVLSDLLADFAKEALTQMNEEIEELARCAGLADTSTERSDR